MPQPPLQQRLITYQQWKTRVARAILEFERWLETHRRATPRAREQLAATLDAIERDRLTIAFVAEVSRGKSELINALFFADFGGRLLPSSGGGTTMCPTEILWDDRRNEPYLRLLPVETRAQEAPIATLREDPKHWVHYPLNLQSPEQLAATLKEILETKVVSLAEATRLGLSSVGTPAEGVAGGNGIVIPKWRHAIISVPHPLLKLGLVILDTPGSGVLGAEPELTISTLPAAQAVVFMVGADVGVAQKDLEIWQHHLKGFRSTRQRAILVALNKIDALWQESRDGGGEAAIDLKRRGSATSLGISPESVFPVSAQKALVAKIRKDDGLLRRSGLPVFERQLALRLLEAKHELLVEVVDATVGQVLDRNRNRIASRITRLKGQLDELERLRDKSDDVIGQLLDKTRGEQERYLRGVQQFQTCREALLAEARHSRAILERDAIESLIEAAHAELLRSWTTVGLNRGMKSLFDELRRVMQTVATESERIRKLVRDTYDVFRDDFGFDVAAPKVFLPMKYRVEIELLFQEVEAFRRSPSMALSNRGVVIRRFHQQMVSRARVLFDQLRVAFDGWIRDTLQPLAEEIQEHKSMMEKRLENLQRIGRSKDALQKRVDAMQTQYVALAQELTALRNIHNALHYDPLSEQEAPARPRLVSG